MALPKLPSFLESRELIGLLCGIGLAALSPSWYVWLESPTLALILLGSSAVLAGFIAAAMVAWAGHRTEWAVRRGTAAAGLALLVTGAFFLGGVGRAGGYPVLRAWMTLGASAVPALLAGTIAAGLGAWRFRRVVTPLPTLVELPRAFRWSALGVIVTGFSPAWRQQEHRPDPDPAGSLSFAEADPLHGFPS